MNSINEYNLNDVRDTTVVGYPGYLITRDGRVWSTKTNKWKSIDSTGCTLLATAPQQYVRQSVKILVSKLFVEPEIYGSGRYVYIMNNRYLISRDGEVYDCSAGEFRAINIVKQYAYVFICDKSVLLHRLVASTFIPNPNNYPEVNHKDGNKLNNSVDNLEWCTRSMNMKHAYEHGFLDNSLKAAVEARVK